MKLGDSGVFPNTTLGLTRLEELLSLGEAVPLVLPGSN